MNYIITVQEYTEELHKDAEVSFQIEPESFLGYFIVDNKGKMQMSVTNADTKFDGVFDAFAL